METNEIYFIRKAIEKLAERIDNLAVKVRDDVAAPAISISGSSVSITCATTGASIYYTTDGTTPTTASNLYTTAISISAATTFKAMAVKLNCNDSEVVTKSVTPSSE